MAGIGSALTQSWWHLSTNSRHSSAKVGTARFLENLPLTLANTMCGFVTHPSHPPIE